MSYLSYVDASDVAVLKMASSSTGKSMAQRLLDTTVLGRKHTEHFDTIMRGSKAILSIGMDPKSVWIRFKDGMIEYAPRVGTTPMFVDEHGNPICHRYVNNDQGREACIRRINALVDALESGDIDLKNAIEAAVQRRCDKRRSSTTAEPKRKIAVYYKEA